LWALAELMEIGRIKKEYKKFSERDSRAQVKSSINHGLNKNS
jgi:hypothetical protein